MRMVCAAVGCGLLMLGGCASTGPGGGEQTPAVRLEPRSVPVFDGHSGSPAAWEEMVEAASSAEVVLIGEMHGHEQGLASAAALWDDVVARAPGEPALCLEFFTRDEQSAIDDYLTGVTDEDGFREAAGRTDRNYPDGHRAMLETARENGLRVYGSNAPRRYSTLAREDGYAELAALRASQRALFVTPAVSPEGPYRDRFFDMFAGMLASHGGEEQSEEELQARIEGYFRAQSVWDSTMAATVVSALAQGQSPVVQVVGQFHSDRDGGLAQAIRRARPGTRIVTVSMTEGPDFENSEDGDLGRADFVLDVGPPEPADGGGDAS